MPVPEGGGDITAVATFCAQVKIAKNYQYIMTNCKEIHDYMYMNYYVLMFQLFAMDFAFSSVYVLVLVIKITKWSLMRLENYGRIVYPGTF